MKTVENKEIIIKVKSDKALRDRQTAMQRRRPQGCKMKVIKLMIIQQRTKITE